jgi:hypothetical protein
VKPPEPRKLSFEEAWETTTEFFVDDNIEKEVDKRIAEICLKTSSASTLKLSDTEGLTKFLRDEKDALDAVLADIGLPQERFKRVVTLLRRKGRLIGGFDREWSIKEIKRRLREDSTFALEIGNIFFQGKEDPFLQKYLPKYYREKLNWKEISDPELRTTRVKESIYRREYANIKGRKIEEIIGKKLETIKRKHGIDYGRGRSRIVDVDVDWAVPGVDNPWVIVMVSYQETTSSGQTTKARDMYNAYDRICRSNSRNRENRAFVNFVDGVGWLARRTDFERLVNECHYFLNLKNLDMLEGIVLRHVPK